MYRLKQLTLLGGDWVAWYLGLFLALILRHNQLDQQQTESLLGPMTVLFGLGTIIIFIAGLYDVTRLKNNAALYRKIILAALVWVVLGVIYFYLNGDAGVAPKTILVLVAMFGFGLIAVWRYFYNRLLSTTLWQTSVIFAGLDQETVEVINILKNNLKYGYKILGVITNKELPADWPEIRKFDRADLAPLNQTNLIVIAPDQEHNEQLNQNIYQNLFNHIQVEKLADFYQKITQRVPPSVLSEVWFLTNLQEQDKKIYDRFRILADYLGAILMAIIFALTFPLIALLIKTTSFGPIFFQQTRAGRGGKNFTIAKYRTMKVLNTDGSAETAGPQFATKDDNRITAVGKWLRLSRLDELPQFINILKNEMALIGPRPERPEFVQQLTAKMPFYNVRHLLKPGLSGWAQLHSNYYGTLDENLLKLEYDLYYLKNRGILLDLAIILRTVNVILMMKGR